MTGHSTTPCRALVAGLGHFSDRFGCTLIAEGIETESELATLRQLAAVPRVQPHADGQQCERRAVPEQAVVRLRDLAVGYAGDVVPE